MSIECNICMNDIVYYILFGDCGHIVCEECFIKLTECPFCRGPIKSHVHANTLNSASDTQLKKKLCSKCSESIEQPPPVIINVDTQPVVPLDNKISKPLCFVACCCVIIPLSIFYIIYNTI
jgi:hypothetical protein